MHKHYVIKYGVYIKSDTMIGYVFYIGIWYRSSDTSNIVIGNNYNISQFLSIGSNHGTPAVIGDNVYIGSLVSIVENVKIGDNTTIGVEILVIKDISANLTAVGVSVKKTTRMLLYIVNKWND